MTLVCAPVPGTVVALENVPDEVFATRMLGPGLAILPDVDGSLDGVASGGGTSAASLDAVSLDAATLDAVSPVAGTLGSLYPHAAVVLIEGRRDRPVLVHLGLDTVELKGEGFTVHTEVSRQVLLGDPLVSWSPSAVAAGGRSPICPVLALGVSSGQVRLVAQAGDRVAAGDPLFEWAD